MTGGNIMLSATTGCSPKNEKFCGGSIGGQRRGGTISTIVSASAALIVTTGI
jgi:hypothetical protein